MDSEALIQPLREPGEAEVPPTAIMTFSPADYRDLCRLAQLEGRSRRLWGCAVREGRWQGTPVAVAAPALGAPYAAMVLEKLIALGAHRVLVLGWCGSLAPQVRLGHLVLPSGAYPGDGTSLHYLADPALISPHPGLYQLLAAHLRKNPLSWHTGKVWSTDAFYRETPSLVRSCRSQGFLALEMELAALFAVARFRGIALAALLVVSDELFDLTWKPARGAQSFRRAREVALSLILAAASSGEGENG